jgi:glycine/D-amino acid oxidase-like deaminating enzyme/nitrite reductase/ring-hydroxylating ferredoxin subunit
MNAAAERTRSLWMAGEPFYEAPRLDRDLQCDVVIVGAGIAGLSVAYELATAGQKVVVVDRGAIGGGMTSRTTAHLAPICDDGIHSLIQLRGEDIARLFHQSQQAAVDRIEAIADTCRISCNFRRLDGFLFPATGMDRSKARDYIDQEYEAARKISVDVERINGVPLKGFEDGPALRYPRQATFHPLKYLKGLIDAIEDHGGMLFSNSAVTKIDEMQDAVCVRTDSGSITAAKAVFATNSPINNRVALHSKMAPYRTYAMAFAIPKDALPDALYWDTADPYHYVRLNPGPGSANYLIVGGEDHKSGEADDGDARFEALEAWIRALVPTLGEPVHRWSGQVLDTIDYCGFIGRNPGNEHVYVATGDSGQGMTHGALAGLLIKDLILTGASPWKRVYEPERKPVAATLNYINENVTAIKNFAEYLMPSELDSVAELKPGQGGIIRDGMAKIAASRDLDGNLHLCSAVCTHLGCHVHWNSTEQCWDCPCHGSQFAPDGSVLNGPAIANLPSATLSAEKKAKANV